MFAHLAKNQFSVWLPNAIAACAAPQEWGATTPTHTHTHIHTQHSMEWHTCQKIVKRNRQKLLRWPWDRHESTTDDDDCSPSRQLFNLRAKGSLPYAALLPAFFITCTVNYWHNKCGGSYNNINWWRQQHTHQPQSEPHSHTHTPSHLRRKHSGRQRGRKGTREIAYINLSK